MDVVPVDTLARHLVQHPSRRRLVRTLAGLGLSAVGERLTGMEAEAKRKHKPCRKTCILHDANNGKTASADLPFEIK